LQSDWNDAEIFTDSFHISSLVRINILN